MADVKIRETMKVVRIYERIYSRDVNNNSKNDKRDIVSRLENECMLILKNEKNNEERFQFHDGRCLSTITAKKEYTAADKYKRTIKIETMPPMITSEPIYRILQLEKEGFQRVD